jgi:DNA-binding Lrp family transcriptional regulator
MAELDLKDKKILFELDTNSRQTYQEIAKKVRLSKDAVFYRIKRLEKEGIVQRYQTLIDVGKLGFISFRIFYKLQNTTSQIEEDIINFLKNHKIVVWMVTIEGYWDINTWILCKEISELELFWKEFISKYLNYLADKRLSIFTDITYFSRAYLLNKKKNDIAIKFVTAPVNIKVDPIDIKILQILNLNARTPILEIAGQIGFSSKQISHRIKNLEKRKIIIGYRTMFDLQKIGYLYYRLHIKVKNLTPEKERLFRNFAFEHPNIIYDHYSICGSDLEIDIQVENVEKLREIIQQIKDNFSLIIQEYEILHYLKEHKYIYIPTT